MVAKPVSVPIALGIVAVGAVLGAFAAPKLPRAAAAQPQVVPEG
jgi:hypothetical protein